MDLLVRGNALRLDADDLSVAAHTSALRAGVQVAVPPRPVAYVMV
jgi:hypothetical protein